LTASRMALTMLCTMRANSELIADPVGDIGRSMASLGSA